MFDMIHAYKQGKILTGTIVWHFNIHAICNGHLDRMTTMTFFFIRFEGENIFTEKEECWTSWGCVRDWRQGASQSTLISENWEAQEGSGQKQGMCVDLSFLSCAVIAFMYWCVMERELSGHYRWAIHEHFLNHSNK